MSSCGLPGGIAKDAGLTILVVFTVEELVFVIGTNGLVYVDVMPLYVFST